RGVDLDAPDDRVTSEEWLEAARAEEVDADPHREIRTEADLIDHTDAASSGQVHRVPTDRLDSELEEVELETAVPDIRETSAQDESERVDPAERRRVPRVDETAATVERAQAALAEIEARK